MKAIVLCAGFGTRLGPLVAQRPKPLLAVGDRTIVEHILHNLQAHGFSTVWINLHHMADQFPKLLGDGSRYGLDLRYLHEREPLGTAGTPRRLLAELSEGTEVDEDETVLVHYGDVLTDHDVGALLRTHRENSAEATIVVHERKGSNSYVFINERGRVERFIERPETPPDLHGQPQRAFSGLCLLSTRVLRDLPDRPPMDLPRDVFPQLAQRGGLHAQALQGYRCAIDSPARLEAARNAVEQGTFHPAKAAAAQRPVTTGGTPPLAGEA